MTKLIIKYSYTYILGNYTAIALCLLAFCVSLGTALVSLTKLFVFLVFIYNIFFKYKTYNFKNLSQHNEFFIWMFFACGWILFTSLWSPASLKEKFYYFTHHSRFVWIFIFYCLITTKEQAFNILRFLIYGQCFVIAISFSMWLGIEIPFTKEPLSNAIAFTSTLDQPIMTSLALISLWCLKSFWYTIYSKFIVNLIILLMSINIIFIMVGRTGYIVFFVLTFLVLLQNIPKKWWWTSFLYIIILFVSLYHLSPKFEMKINHISYNTILYINDKPSTTSESARLDMWSLTLSGIKKNLVFGNGLGSISYVYKNEGGVLLDKVSQPHQQYLFWWSEFGIIGFIIMMYFFVILFKDSKLTKIEYKNLMRFTLISLFVTGLFNCPFFGVGVGEFFFITLSASLFLIHSDQKNKYE